MIQRQINSQKDIDLDFLFDPQTLEDLKTPTKNLSGRMPSQSYKLDLIRLPSAKSNKDKKTNIRD